MGDYLSFLPVSRNYACCLLFRRMTLNIFLSVTHFSIQWHESEVNMQGLRFQSGKHLRIDWAPTAGSQMNRWYMGNVWTWRQWCDLLLLFFFTIKCLNSVRRLTEWLVLVRLISKLKESPVTTSWCIRQFRRQMLSWWFVFPEETSCKLFITAQISKYLFNFAFFHFMRMMAVCENVQTRCERF